MCCTFRSSPVAVFMFRGAEYTCPELLELLYFIYSYIFCWYFVIYKRLFYSYHYVIQWSWTSLRSHSCITTMECKLITDQKPLRAIKLSIVFVRWIYFILKPLNYNLVFLGIFVPWLLIDWRRLELCVILLWWGDIQTYFGNDV